jgi:hypothetical protein
MNNYVTSVKGDFLSIFKVMTIVYLNDMSSSDFKKTLNAIAFYTFYFYTKSSSDHHNLILTLSQRSTYLVNIALT